MYAAFSQWTLIRTAIAAAILAPLCLSGPIPGSSRDLDFCLPRIHSGDEPHYLVTLHSLLIDGDLDVSNNYDAVHKGAQTQESTSLAFH
jgi:hypothetical protein